MCFYVTVIDIANDGQLRNEADPSEFRGVFLDNELTSGYSVTIY